MIRRVIAKLRRAVTRFRRRAERFTRAGRTKRHHASYDEWTSEIIDRVLVDTSNAIDVGAHEGVILRHMLERSPRGRLFAFEPIPSFARLLRTEFPTAEVHEVALAEAPGRTEFVHVVTNPAYSGLRQRRYDRPHEELERIEVEIARLDDIVPPDVPIALIKIDVEGGELGVLRGGLETIKRSRPHIVFEHGMGAADHYGTTPEAVYDLLVGDCGLRINRLDAYLRGRTPMDRSAFVDEFTSGRNYYFVAFPG